MCDEMAIKLIDEYEASLRAGQSPKSTAYLARYNGPNPRRFEIDLKIADMLTRDGIRARRFAEKAIKETTIEQNKQKLLSRIVNHR